MWLCSLTTTHEQALAHTQTGSEVWAGGGQLYRDGQCLVRMVVRFKQEPAIRVTASGHRHGEGLAHDSAFSGKVATL